MPQPKVKADAVYKVPIAAGAGGAAGKGGAANSKLLQKISTVEELAVLEQVVDEERPRLRKPGFAGGSDDAKPAALVKPAAAAPAPAAYAAPAPAPVAAAPAAPEYDEVVEEVTDDEQDPNALPDGWAAMQDEEGDTFYYNAATQEAVWEKPAAPKKMKKVVKRVPRAPAPAPAAAAKPAFGGGLKVAPKTAAAPAPAPAPAAATKTWGTGAAAGGASKFGGASAGAAKAAAPAPAAAAGGAVVGDGEPDPEACDSFEPNPFKKEICKKCRKKNNKHPQYF